VITPEVLRSPKNICVSQMTTDMFVCCNMFVVKIIRLVLLVELELLTLREHPRSLLVFNGVVCVVQSLVFCFMFCGSMLVHLSFFLLAIALLSLLRFTTSDYLFGLRLLITSLVYDFWLPLWFLQTCRVIVKIYFFLINIITI